MKSKFLLIKYISVLFVALFALSANGQNPLKKKLKGKKKEAHYSPSDYEFLNKKGKTVKLNPVLDNRSSNWNKQINDSVKIDLIRDFWKEKYTDIINSKFEKDLKIAGIDLNPSLDKNVYEITPKVDIHFPEYVVHPKNGYYVLSRIVMDVKQNNNTLFKKAYQDYFYFYKGISGYDEKYDKNYIDGTDMAMSISMKKVIDQFYDDLDKVFGGEKVKSYEGPIEVKAIASNIAKDKNLNDDKKPFSQIKNKKDVMETDLTANNYKVKEEVSTKSKKDPKLEEGLKKLGIDKKKEAEEKEKALALKKKKEEAKKKAEIAKKKKIEAEKKKALALKQEEIAKKKKIDSLAKVKKAEEEKLATAKKIEDDKQAKLVQAKKDSIKKANDLALAKKVRAQKVADSLKKVEVNKNIALAKKKEAEKRKQLEAKKLKAELAKKKLEAAKKKKMLALEQKKKQTKQVAKPKVTSKAKSYASKSTRRSDESMSEAVRRIAREIEAEERGTPLTKKEKTMIAKNSGKTKAPAKEIAQIKKKIKTPVVKKKPTIKVKPVDPMKYRRDSLEFLAKLQKRREAILKAQKAAQEAEKRDLIVNPNAGAMFAMVSTDPPNKMPDSRTREEKLRDRVFTPRNELSKALLSRVKMITPSEEMKLLADMTSPNTNTVDSIYIQYQKSRPKMTEDEMKELTSSSTKKEVIEKKIEEKKAEETTETKSEATFDDEKKPSKDELEKKIAEKKAEILKKIEETKKKKAEAATTPKKVVETKPKVEPAKTATDKEAELKKRIAEKKAAILKKLEAAKKGQ